MGLLIGILTAAMLFSSEPLEMPVPAIYGEFPYCYGMELVKKGEPELVYEGFFSSQATGQTSTSYHSSPYLPEKLVLTGPEEGSGFNSRSYYLRIYARDDTWTVDQYLYGSLAYREEVTVNGYCLAQIVYEDKWISHDG